MGVLGIISACLLGIASAGKSVVDALHGQIVYVNVMNRLSIDCDCNGNPAEPDMHDIGILASRTQLYLTRHTLEHAEEIGLGIRYFVNNKLGKCTILYGKEGERYDS